jgi:SNF2 family DNA or RNA helicase
MDDPITILNKVFTQNNHVCTPVPFNSPYVRTTLLPHQLQMVRLMQTHKQNMMFGAIRDQQFISGKLGIVGDPPGSGKTLSVLAFLAAEEPQTRPAIGELHPQSNRFFSSHMVPNSSDISSVNVIVVPPTLLQQWQDEIKQHTRLNPFIIQNRRVLRNRGTPQAILESHFILTTNRMYREVHTYCQEHNLGWKNLFFDEVEIVQHPHRRRPWLL